MRCVCYNSIQDTKLHKKILLRQYLTPVFYKSINPNLQVDEDWD